MPFYQPPQLANTLYLTMLRQQELDMAEKQRRFDVEEGNRMSSMQAMAGLQQKKLDSERVHQREMEKLGLEREAMYRQEGMKQQAAGGREVYKQEQTTGRTLLTEKGKRSRAEGRLGLGYAGLGIRAQKLELQKSLAPFRKKLMQAKTGMVEGIGRESLIANILQGAAKELEKQATAILKKSPWERTSPEQQKMAMDIMVKATKMRGQIAEGLKQGRYNVDQILGMLGGESATGIQQGMTGGGGDIAGMPGYTTDDLMDLWGEEGEP